jgi:hypothetical protein
MTDEELMEQAPSLPVLYFDGYGAYRKLNGVLRCVGYTLGLGAQYNLITSLAGAEQAILDARRVLDEKPVQTIGVWSGSTLAH